MNRVLRQNGLLALGAAVEDRLAFVSASGLLRVEEALVRVTVVVDALLVDAGVFFIVVVHVLFLKPLLGSQDAVVHPVVLQPLFPVRVRLLRHYRVELVFLLDAAT
jgi:hypothetical protein